MQRQAQDIHRCYEFRLTVVIVVTSRSNFIVGVLKFLANPYDCHALKTLLSQVEWATRKKAEEGFVNYSFHFLKWGSGMVYGDMS